MKLLNKIQQALHAPKGQKNEFGGYNYRSAEDILASVKPLLGTGHLRLTDEVVEIGGRVYVKATAILSDGEHVADATAYAREQFTRKGMDEAQVTGAASSYARKYALAGLFAIDNEKDPDTKTLSVSEQIEAQTNYDSLRHYWGFLSDSEQKEHLDQFKAKAETLKGKDNG